jgi:hypothetical protein
LSKTAEFYPLLEKVEQNIETNYRNKLVGFAPLFLKVEKVEKMT